MGVDFTIKELTHHIQNIILQNGEMIWDKPTK